MIDATVSNFFSKNPESSYMKTYEYSHGPRLDALVAHYDLKTLRGRVADIGGGMGFLGKRLDPSVDYWVIDGADIPGVPCRGPLGHVSLCKGVYVKQDIDRDYFSYLDWYDTDTKERLNMNLSASFDAAFFLETIEHCQSPYHAMLEIKKIVKPNGLVYISTPTETVWHNTPFPSLIWPPQNFVQWLGQLAFPVVSAWEYHPQSVGWPAYHYVCRNADWVEADMLYKKDEPKFRGKKPHEYANL